VSIPFYFVVTNTFVPPSHEREIKGKLKIFNRVRKGENPYTVGAEGTKGRKTVKHDPS